MPALAAALALARRTMAESPAPPARPDSARAPAPQDSAAAPAMPEGAAAVAPPAPPSVTLAAAGDTTLGYNLQAHLDEQLATGVAQESLWPLYFGGVRGVLAAADLSLVNLECPFTTAGKKLPKNFNFSARPELVEILKAGGVGAVTLANNHLMDYGGPGLVETLATLRDAGIAAFGAGEDLARARRPLVLERNGLSLAFLGYYFQAPPDMLEPKAVYATRKKPGVAGCYRSIQCMRRMLDQDLESLVPAVDAAIVYFHWGREGSYEVQDYQVELAHRAVDLGCKAVLGAHPHRLQGVEVYRGAPVFYSLGNFVFGGNKDPQDKLSAIARLRLTREGVAEADLVPIQITRWPEAPFQPFVLEGAARDRALARLAGLSRGFSATLPQLAGYDELLPAAPAAGDSTSGWQR